MEMEQDLQRETDEIEATTRSTVPGSAVSQIGQKKPDATTAEDSSGAVGVTTQMDTSEMVLDDDPDGRSVYVGNVRLIPLASVVSSDRFRLLGRLWSNSRGDPSSFRFLWNHKPGHNTSRQIHWTSKRVSETVSVVWSTLNVTSNSYAYVEFAQPAHVEAAVVLNESLFRGRLIKVSTIDFKDGFDVMTFYS